MRKRQPAVAGALYRLRRWSLSQDPSITFYTCARPGRKVSATDPIPDSVVEAWVENLERLGPRPALISLLGRKPRGASEYSFYSFHGGFDCAQGAASTPSFGEWLQCRVPDI